MKNKLTENILNDNNIDLSSNAILLFFRKLLFESDYEISLLNETKNPLINKILKGRKFNPVIDTLSKLNFCENTPNMFFTEEVFAEEHEFKQLSILCNTLVKCFQDKNYKLFIDSIDQFNNIVVERLFLFKLNKRPSNDYGSVLKNDSFISREMIGVRENFCEIHQLRNIELHPKDSKSGKFNSGKNTFKQKAQTMEKIFSEWKNSILEIIKWYNNNKK